MSPGEMHFQMYILSLDYTICLVVSNMHNFKKHYNQNCFILLKRGCDLGVALTFNEGFQCDHNAVRHVLPR